MRFPVVWRNTDEWDLNLLDVYRKQGAEQPILTNLEYNIGRWDLNLLDVYRIHGVQQPILTSLGYICILMRCTQYL